MIALHLFSRSIFIMMVAAITRMKLYSTGLGFNAVII